jgi:predicted nucleic acid-binding protein
VAVFYADASALVKLVREEAESGPLRAYLAGADLVSSELVLTEIPRAVRRATAHDPALPLNLLLERTGELIDAFVSYDERQAAVARLAGLRTMAPGA